MKKTQDTLYSVQKNAERARDKKILGYLEKKGYKFLGVSGEDPEIYFYQNENSIICLPKPEYDELRPELGMEWETEDFMDRFYIEKEQIDALGSSLNPIDTDDIVEYIQEEHNYAFSCC